MQCTLVLLPFVFSLVVVAAHQINITKDYELEEFLCSGTQLLNDTTVKLSTTISHIIRNASFCIINTTYSLSITSNSSQQAVIQCNDSIIQPTSGFAFTNIHNLTLQRLVFKRCGGYLKGLELKKFTRFPFNLTQYHSAVSLFLKIKALVIKEVDITHYYGFAMFSINPMNAIIDHCEVSLSNYGGNHSKHKKGYGSGIFLLFANDTELPSSTFNVSINQSTFYSNFESNHEPKNICFTGFNSMVNAAGLTILYIHNSFAVHVNVTQSIFIYNLANIAAGILIIHYNSALQSQTRIINSTFKQNFNNKMYKRNCPGSDLLLHFYISNDNIQYSNDISHPLVVSKTNFSGHNALNSYDQGIIYINISNPSTFINVTITFNEVHFKSIRAHGTGSCLYAVSDASPHNVQIIMKDITAVKNFHLSAHFFHYTANHIITIKNFDILYLRGKSNYTNNYGSVFSAINTKVILSDQPRFENNTGIMGAAFSLIGSSRFILQDGLVAVFNRNSALISGGAIYAYNNFTNECMFTPNGSNISMLFRHNTATYSGNSIFSNNLYNCWSTMLPNNLPVPQAAELYHNISNGTLNGGLSTIVEKLCVCQPNSSTCTILDAVIVYPGMTLYFSIAAFDAFNQITYTEISLNLVIEGLVTNQENHLPSLNWYIDSNGKSLSQGKCTLVNIPLFKRHDIVDTHYLALIIIASITPQEDRHLNVYLLPCGCPVGFEFDQTTRRCKCSHVFYKLGYRPVCKITSDGYNPHITIKLAVKGLSKWIGVINSTNKFIFGVSNVCYRYCNYNRHYDTFMIHENMVMLTNSDDDYGKKVNLCSHNREGPLCSQCAPGYSAVFGSVYHCKQCSNWWLLTLLVYGIAGPLLVLLLYTFNLTLTSGKINAIIFYAQILNTNVPVPFMLEIERLTLKTIYVTVTGLLFLINLTINFNLPLCLYNGMTELWKSGIGLMFPVYLLTIVIGLIIISRYSVRLSNRIADSSVQVLVTVVHLSVATLLSSILDIFTPAYIYTNTSDVPLKVWQSDGTVEYGKGGHLILMIVTGVVVGSILITYLTVLLAGRPLMKINKVREYLRPIYEAIHAPYKRNKEFFFASSIIFVVFLYLLSATLLSNNPNLGLMIGIPVTCIYITVVGYSQPFKDTRLNILNVFVFSFIIALAGSALSSVDPPASSVLVIIVVILCHITVIITVLCIFMSQFAFVKKFVRKFKMAYISKRNPHSAVHQRDIMNCDSFYQSCSEREPLLVDK